jgi:hypothetical protein
MSRAKREALTKKERASAVRAKRKHDPDPERKGSPINVSNFGKGKISEDMENLNEKNVPTNPELWSRAKSLARSKFDVYPSAYANGWASKWYKGKGGSWKSVSEESEHLEEVREVGDDPTTADYPEGLNVKKGRVVTKMAKEEKDSKEYGYEGDMAINQLKTIMRHAEYLIDMMKPDTDLPEWVQSKITLAADYIQTSCDYLTSEMDESVNESDVYGKPTTEKTPTVTLKHKTSGKEIVVTKKSAKTYHKLGYYAEAWSKTGKVAKHNKTGEETHEYAKVDSEGRKTGEREYRNAQGKPMGEEFAGWVAHYNGQKHEIKSHEAKDLYDAKQKAIAHFKLPKSKHGLLSVKPGVNEEVEQIDEISRKTMTSYISKAEDDVLQKQKAIKNSPTNSPQLKHSRAMDLYKRYGNINKAYKKVIAKEETQIDEISRGLADRYLGKVTQQQVQKQGIQPNMYDKLPKNRQQGVSNAFKRVLVKSPVKEETVEEQLYKQGRFVTGAGKKPFKAPTLASPRVEESRGHKMIATFFKNRDTAQKAFTGQNKTEKPKQEPEKQKVLESRKAEIVKNIMKKKKSDKFEPDPVISDTQSKSDQTV